MSKRHKAHNLIQRVEEAKQGSTLVSSFGDKVGVDMKDTNALMNWIIFGDITRTFRTESNTNEF